MEQIPESAIISIPNNITTDPLCDGQHKPTQQEIKKKKNGPMHVLRVALLMMRGRSKKSSILHVDNGSTSTWGKFVGSMRPLHLQRNQSMCLISQPPTTLPSPSQSEYKSNGGGYVLDFMVEEESYSPSPPSSHYASAVGLNELVQSDEENGKQEVIIEECKENDDGKDDGDDMIDSKADEFIARFYEQMRLQRMNSVDRRYIERNQREQGRSHQIENRLFDFGYDIRVLS